ncbi:hypothetical protein RP726_00920 [Candidatus Methylospira mobilis]|uniref:hypothetical protein n=1 Tax=Candidatus Methylospira mobilis TaxID=1808979 RepID=UPI0028E9A6BA|nr:hypothetical protein [Candidatus Methylospira mobilis]WNV04991.1 hypothetical protein RP726_00920 [Candidatus Methylospira mobilis]
MREQAATLSAEVATLQAQAEDWEKRGGWAKLITCGEKRRLSVQIDTKQSFEGGYYIIKGY